MSRKKYFVVLGSNGRFVIPKSMRKILGLTPGIALEAVFCDGLIIIGKPKDSWKISEKGMKKHFKNVFGHTIKVQDE